MTIEEIKELLEIFNQSGVGELEVERGGNRVRIRRSSTGSEIPPPIAMPYPLAAPVPAVAPVPLPVPAQAVTAPPATANAVVAAPAAAETDTVPVKSPIVGTFYEAPSPGAPPFVKPGDHVSPGQVLCIIESMKLMNEIEAEVAGVIVSKLVENGKPVEYGQALFTIRPS
jgi:acetyl-CoA carboxylase biotin carboxyl carrier protein